MEQDKPEQEEEVTMDQLASAMLTFIGITETCKLRMVDAIDDALVVMKFDDPSLIEDVEIRTKLQTRGAAFAAKFEKRTREKALSSMENLAESLEQTAAMVREALERAG